MLFVFLIASMNLYATPQGCDYLGGQMLDEKSKFSFNREQCQGQLVLFLKDHSKVKTGTIVHHYNVRKLTGKEKMEDSYVCYLKSNPDKFEFFYGIFDFAKSGTLVKGPGKLVAAWKADQNTKKIVTMDQKYLDDIRCQEEPE